MNEIIYILLEKNDNNKIKYLAMGEVVNDKFNGVIYGYVGGGQYDDWYVYQDKFLPTSIHNDFVDIDQDTVVHWFVNLCPQLKDIPAKIYKSKYTEYSDAEGVLYFKPFISNFGRGVCWICWNGKIFSKGRFAPISFGNTEFSKKEEYWSFEELKSLIDWKTVAKKEFDRFQVIGDVKLSSNDLLVKTAEFLKEDSVWKGLIDTKKATKFLETIVQDIEACGEDIYDIDIRDCDICDCCGKVLLPDDELYISYSGETLCHFCSVRCAGCEQYFSVDYEMTDVDGLLVCSNCAKKQKFEIQAKRTEYLKTEIYANSYEEALKDAEEHFDMYLWNEIDGSMETEIIKDMK